MVTPLTSSTTNNPEVVDFLLEKARHIEGIKNFLMRIACDIACGKVEWDSSLCELIYKEIHDFRGDLSRAEIELTGFLKVVE